MTEADWLSCSSLEPMLAFLRDRGASERKLRLFACGCCRLVWDLLADHRCHIAVRKLEDYADDLGNEKLRRDAYNTANAAYSAISDTFFQPPTAAACTVLVAAYREVPPNLRGNFCGALMGGRRMTHDDVRRLEADLLHDIFGNPFRSATLAPSCLTPTVTALAQRVYETRDFTPMPILADALADAGCEDAQVLDHCRGGGVHVRGCWVVDAVLGKS